MTYNVTFRKEFNGAGEGTDYPTDFFHVPSEVIEDTTFIEMRPPADNSQYGEEEWKYEISEDREGEFEAACERCQTVISYKRCQTVISYKRGMRGTGGGE